MKKLVWSKKSLGSSLPHQLRLILKDIAIKLTLPYLKELLKVVYENPLQLFRTLLGFRNILTKTVCSPPSW